ncbi:TPA: hypothetical protein HA251_08445 [Candidatus Woesearchaeota archaeon]|nr:hypothetical protein [Candidatus Woesearchaeota archaeon]
MAPLTITRETIDEKLTLENASVRLLKCPFYVVEFADRLRAEITCSMIPETFIMTAENLIHEMVNDARTGEDRREYIVNTRNRAYRGTIIRGYMPDIAALVSPEFGDAVREVYHDLDGLGADD